MFHFITIGIIIAHFIYVGIFYSSLPDKIAIHFDIKGEADNWGSKQMIWLLPALAVFTYLLLAFCQYTDNYNVPKEMDHSSVTNLLTHMNLGTQLIYFIISYVSVEVSLGKRKKLGGMFMAAIFILILYPFLHLIKV